MRLLRLAVATLVADFSAEHTAADRGKEFRFLSIGSESIGEPRAPPLGGSSTSLQVNQEANNFDGAACRAAKELPNFQLASWKELCDTPEGRKHDNCGKGGQEVYGVVVSGNQRLCYVRNQKAASKLITNELGALFDSVLSKHPKDTCKDVVSPSEVRKREFSNTTVFTFVRDPFVTALDAYLEVRLSLLNDFVRQVGLPKVFWTLAPYE